MQGAATIIRRRGEVAVTLTAYDPHSYRWGSTIFTREAFFRTINSAVRITYAVGDIEFMAQITQPVIPEELLPVDINPVDILRDMFVRSFPNNPIDETALDAARVHMNAVILQRENVRIEHYVSASQVIQFPVGELIHFRDLRVVVQSIDEEPSGEYRVVMEIVEPVIEHFLQEPATKPWDAAADNISSVQPPSYLPKRKIVIRR